MVWIWSIQCQLSSGISFLVCQIYKPPTTEYSLFKNELKRLFGGLHILPFYYPIDGEDAGFDPIDHNLIDPRLGDWNDLKELSEEVDIMADLIVNHVSAKSIQFQDYLQKGKESKYAKLFLTYDTVFPNGATEADLLSIYRPRSSLAFTMVKLNYGTSKLIWTTFTSNQIDIDVNSEIGNFYRFLIAFFLFL